MISEKIELRRMIPQTPGVYIMKNAAGRILYIGKAGNLRRRVESYFSRPQEFRIERLLQKVHRIDFKKTDTAIEALILESALIKKHQPEFNIREKDDKSFLYVEITREKFPRVLLARKKDLPINPLTPDFAPAARGSKIENPAHSDVARRSISQYFGPFTSAGNLREALRIIRRIFPWNMHSAEQMANGKWRVARGRGRITPRNIPPAEGTASHRPCFEYEIGLCPGACAGTLSPRDYQKTVRSIVLFLNGKKQQIIKNLEREMKTASKQLEFEKAAESKRQLFALQHIQDVAFITDSRPAWPNNHRSNPSRIEGYDISNISGTSAVGAMVVFENGRPSKDEYRKFRIKTVIGANDVAMIREVLTRRFQNSWPHPRLILIDGGKPQVRAAREVIAKIGGKIPVVGIAKGPKRDKNEFHGAIPRWIDPRSLIRVRDEAHRFAIQYHKNVRGKEFLP